MKFELIMRFVKISRSSTWQVEEELFARFNKFNWKHN